MNKYRIWEIISSWQYDASYAEAALKKPTFVHDAAGLYQARDKSAAEKYPPQIRHDIIKGAKVPLLYNINEEGGKNMKTRKIIIGTMAAAMLSLSVCSLIPAMAAGDTVQITAGKATVKAGEQFEVEVSLADIPAAGAQACNFSIEFDNSIITIDEITAGALTETGAGASDPSASLLPNFNVYLDSAKTEGFVSVMWSTSLDDPSYWLKGEGVLCKVKGTVAANAKAGAKSDLKIVPVKRMTTTDSGVLNDAINCGYLKDSEKVAYNVSTTSGSVTVEGATAPTQEPTKAPDGNVLRGDANCDGKVTIADATAILQSLGNPDKYGLSEQGAANADVADPSGVTTEDALRIQKYDAGLISADEL